MSTVLSANHRRLHLDQLKAEIVALELAVAVAKEQLQHLQDDCDHAWVLPDLGYDHLDELTWLEAGIAIIVQGKPQRSKYCPVCDATAPYCLTTECLRCGSLKFAPAVDLPQAQFSTEDQRRHGPRDHPAGHECLGCGLMIVTWFYT